MAAQNPPGAGQQPVAIIAGQPVPADELAAAVESRLTPLRREEYDIKRRALEEIIEKRLLEAEAARRGISVEDLLEAEVTSKAGEPTDEDVEAFYETQRERINRPLEAVAPQIRRVLRDARRKLLRDAFVGRLRDHAVVTILLRPPRSEVAADPARFRGPRHAPILIIEFSDYQCPFCRRVQSTIRQVLERYADRVSHAYRDFPLDDIHPRARRAAEAARCAAEQGKFWPYHETLFANFGQLAEDQLSAHATSAGLDQPVFRACLQSGRYREAVEQDNQEALRLGLSGTPAFFINGIFLNGAQPLEEFERVIEEELAAMEALRKLPASP